MERKGRKKERKRREKGEKREKKERKWRKNNILHEYKYNGRYFGLYKKKL